MVRRVRVDQGNGTRVRKTMVTRVRVSKGKG